MTGWIAPTIGYVVILGIGGVTAKLALKTITWQQLVLWVPVVYVTVAFVLLVFKGVRFPLGVGGAWGALTAVCMASALILFFYALTKGSAGQVVPASSAYPVVTLIASALFLSEKITLTRGLGTALVIAGVAVISR
jgi:uncharacterized membrane protein